jgi:hypothetical protein
MPLPLRTAGVCLLSLFVLLLCSCGVTIFGHLSYARETADPLTHYALTGDTLAVLDPSIIRQNSTYYAFSTDVAGFSMGATCPCTAPRTG